MAKEKEPFVVQDRRRFSSEGELTQSEESAQESAVPPPPVEESTATEVPPEAEEVPPPTAAEQQQQHEAYADAGKNIDDLLKTAGAPKRPPMEVNFEGLVNSLSVQAMMQLGVLREEGAPMRPDIIGARQTIDILTMLQEKTKGNLSEREITVLQSALFELRMAFVEITKAVTRAPAPGEGGVPPMPGAKR